MFTGRLYDSAELLDAGFARSIHSPDALLDAAYALAEEFVHNSAPVSVALTRRLLWRMLCATDPVEAHRLESRGLAKRGSSDDAREGVAAFLERRPAQFAMSVALDCPDIF